MRYRLRFVCAWQLTSFKLWPCSFWAVGSFMSKIYFKHRKMTMTDMKKNLLQWLPAAILLLATGCGIDDGGYTYNGGWTTMVGESMEGEMPGDKFEDFSDNPFVSTVQTPVSTFSVDADGASYAIVRRYLNMGLVPQAGSVRIEELLNYFTFDYAAPADGQTVAINGEVGACPWTPTHRLLRLGMKGRELNADEMPRANFVFLVDVSGSMQGADRLDLLKSGLKQLLFQLNPDDRISLITYSGQVSKLLESTPVSEAAVIVKAIDKLSASGSTAGGEALKMAYEEALANYDAKANNRVIMGTDGDFNVGVSNTDELEKLVEGYARRGIYLTCLGFGVGNLNDGMMERISNTGNGNYYYIDSENEMMKVFVHDRAHFVSVANDAKCQVTFDSTMVSSYRLIGYENRVMGNQDFVDDKKDAGEIGAGQTVTALYEIVPTEKYIREEMAGRHEGFATFDFCYKKSLDDSSLPLSLLLTTGGAGQPASANLTFAAGVAAYGMVLRQSVYRGDATCQMAKELVGGSLSFDPHGYRAELLRLIGKIRD